MHQEQNSSVLALSMGPWKYQMVLTSKQRAQHKDAVLVAQICILKYSRHCMQTDMLSVASLSLSEVGVACRQLSLVVILFMQAAMTVGAIRIHNEVLQVLNQDVVMNGSACPAEDDKVINIHSEEWH